MLSPFPLEVKPQKLVENRRSFGGNDIEFSIYDTYQKANKVELQATNPLYCGMITGKKVIHFRESEPFSFLPNESLVLPSSQKIYIDFPDAVNESPTQCITIEIEKKKLENIVSRINEDHPRMDDSGDWEYEDNDFVHFDNNDRFNQNLEQIVRCFTDKQPYRDLLIDLNASRLIIHMLQSEARKVLLKAAKNRSCNSKMESILDFINQNLQKRIAIKDLERISHMSKSSLFRAFKNEMGVSPVEYVNTERMKLAAKMLRNGKSVTDACYDCGFGSQTHFIKTFKNHFKMTPGSYKKNLKAKMAG